MKGLLKRVFSRKSVIGFTAFTTLCDLVFTFFVLKRYGNSDNFSSGEFNPLIRYFMETAGLEITLFVIVPLVMITLLLLIWRFWNFKPLRYYAYFLFVTRVGLFLYNIHIVFLVFKN